MTEGKTNKIRTRIARTAPLKRLVDTDDSRLPTSSNNNLCFKGSVFVSTLDPFLQKRESLMGHALLIMLHCKQNTGYAIAKLETVFKEAATLAGFHEDRIFMSYTKIEQSATNVFEIDYYSSQDAEKLRKIISDQKITSVLAFDMPFPCHAARVIRRMEVMQLVSYWGASMSSINRGLTLLAKRSEWLFRSRNAPTHFIFESEAMRETATHGRGVPKSRTLVIPLGVDTEQFSPKENCRYAHRVFGIPEHRKILFFSGHMEERKGVRVLIQAMLELQKVNELEHFHLLICGNKDKEDQIFRDMLCKQAANNHVTFAGYRDDIPDLMRSSFVGTIASTGWDSFTMSAVEMMASGLPLVVSELQGLKETIEPGVSGHYIKPGDFKSLANIWQKYAENPKLRQAHAKAARERAVSCFSRQNQIEQLSRVLSECNYCKSQGLSVSKAQLRC